MLVDHRCRLAVQKFVTLAVHLRFVAQREAALHTRAFAYRFEPALKIREVAQVLPLAFVRHDPRPTGDIGDRVLTGQVLMVAQLPLHDAVQSIDFLRIALDAIRHVFKREGSKVVRLSGHRAEAADLPEQPGLDASSFFELGGQKLPGFLGQVNQDGAGLEHADPGVLIDDRRDLVVRGSRPGTRAGTVRHDRCRPGEPRRANRIPQA